MTAFVHPDLSFRHQGAERAAFVAEALEERLVLPLRRVFHRFSVMAGLGNAGAEEERQLWNAAMEGDRTMAELHLAVRRAASPDANGD